MSFFSIWPLSIVVYSSHYFEFNFNAILDLDSNHWIEIDLTNRKFENLRFSDNLLIHAALQPLSPLCFEDHALETVELFPAIFNFEKPSPIELLNIIKYSNIIRNRLFEKFLYHFWVTNTHSFDLSLRIIESRESLFYSNNLGIVISYLFGIWKTVQSTMQRKWCSWKLERSN